MGGISWEKSNFSIIQHFFNERNITDKELIIDVGCASGYFLSCFYKDINSGWQLYGIDISQKAIIKGKKKYPFLKLFCKEGENIGFPDNKFGVVVSYGSLEHFSDPLKALKEISRIMKKKGYFFIMIPTLGYYRTDTKKEGWYEDLDPLHQKQWNYKRSTWEKKFDEADLTLFPISFSKKFGALKLGNFYIGQKRYN